MLTWLLPLAVHDEEDLPIRVLDQSSKELHEHPGREPLPEHRPSHLATADPMRRAAEEPSQPFDGTAMPHGHRHHQTAEVLPGRAGEVLAKRPVERLSSRWDSADGKHAATPSISSCGHSSYRQNPPLVSCLCYHQSAVNWSVRASYRWGMSGRGMYHGRPAPEQSPPLRAVDVRRCRSPPFPERP